MSTRSKGGRTGARPRWTGGIASHAADAGAVVPGDDEVTGRPTLPVRVFVVSEVRLVRDAITRSLASCEGIDVCEPLSHLSDGAAAAAVGDGILLIELPLLRSRDALRAIQLAAPRARLVAFAVGDVAGDIVACAEAGLSGYVLKDDSIEDLLATVRRVAAGEWSVTPRAAAMLFRHVGALAADRPPRSGVEIAHADDDATRPDGSRSQLTLREADVLRLMESGRSNKEIARALHIEVTTVKNHVHNILGKLGVASRGQAAWLVRDEGTRHTRR